jgi:uncharacterized protein involved in cysteine biosynthesis
VIHSLQRKWELAFERMGFLCFVGLGKVASLSGLMSVYEEVIWYILRHKDLIIDVHQFYKYLNLLDFKLLTISICVIL